MKRICPVMKYEEELVLALRKYVRADGARYGIHESDIPDPLEKGIEILESFGFVRGGHADNYNIHAPIWWNRKKEPGEITEEEKEGRLCGACLSAPRETVEPECPDCWYKHRPLEMVQAGESAACIHLSSPIDALL